MTRRGRPEAVAFLVVAAGLLLLVAWGGAQELVDAKSLVGEWMGRWRSSAGSSDNIYITVAAVEGEKVHGSVFMAVATPGLGYYNRDVPFSGVFDGAELSLWVPPALWISLKVSGERMQGFVRGQQTFGTVELDRKH